MIHKDKDLKKIFELPGNDIAILKLINQLATGRGVVPFVGAGISMNLGYPSWTCFLTQIGERNGLKPKTEELLVNGQYEEAAEFLIEEIGDQQFRNEFENQFGKIKLKDLQAYGPASHIPYLSEGVVITTNFDQVLESSFLREGKPFMKVISGTAMGDTLLAERRNNLTLLKLHGDLLDPNNRILTLTEYCRAYGGMTAATIDFKRKVPEQLMVLALTRPLLFIGCSLHHDRTLQVMLEAVRKQKNAEHYAILALPKNPNAKKDLLRRLGSLNITIVWLPPFEEGGYQLLEPLLYYLTKPKRNSKNDDPLTSFVGREEDLEILSNLLLKHRMVTITGLGGSGKTRLARQLCQKERDRFPDGCKFIKLANLKDPDLLPNEIAIQAGLNEQARGLPTEILSEQLGSLKALIVLDNCEELDVMCSDIAREILSHGTEVRLLATSTKWLSSDVTINWPLGPLELIEATKLFIDRARSVDPKFEATPEDSKAIESICKMLGCLPLLIELAAPKCRIKTPADIYTSLMRDPSLLENRDGNVPDRHKTVDATIRWSYRFLSDFDQMFLCRLSVFRGGCSFQQAKEICFDNSVTENEVSKHLEILLDNSLIWFTKIPIDVDPSGRRFHLLEPIRIFCETELDLSSLEGCQLRDKHCKWFLVFAQAREPVLASGGDNQVEVLNQFQIEHDNIRAAMDWCKDKPDGITGLKLGINMWRFWEQHCFYREGQQELEQFISFPLNTGNTDLVGQASSGLGMLCYRQGHFASARIHYERALKIAVDLGDPARIAQCENDMGNVDNKCGDILLAQIRFKNGYERAMIDLNNRHIGVGLFNLGDASLSLNRLDEAEAMLTESLSRFRKGKNETDIGYPLNMLGWVAFWKNDFEKAKILFEEAFLQRKPFKSQRGMFDSVEGLCRAYIAEGNFKEARARLIEGMELAYEIVADLPIARQSECAALLSHKLGNSALALKFLGAARAIRIREEIGSPLPPIFAEAQAIWEDEAKRSMSPNMADKMVRDGSTLTRPQLLALVQDLSREP